MQRTLPLQRKRPLQRTRGYLACLLATAVLTAACSSDDPVQTAPGSTDRPGGALLPDSTVLAGDDIILTAAGLQAAPDCDALLSQLRAFGSDHVGPYGFGDGFYGPIARFGVDEEMAMDDDGGSEGAFAPETTIQADSAESSDAAGGDFSGTNNQEAGVDEPDMTKTDGERIITLSNGKIQVFDVASASIETTISLPEGVWANRMFLNGDRVLVMTEGWTEVSFAADDVIYPYGGVPTTQILDVSIDSGEIERILEIEGSHLSAREVGGTARIVISSPIGQQFDFLYPSGNGAEDAAEKANRTIVEESTIDQWIPTYRLTDGDGKAITEGTIAPCDRFYVPSEFSGFGTLSVLTVDLNKGLEVQDQLSVLTTGQTIYASTERLTVATSRFPEFGADGQPERDEEFTTALHSFDISDAATTGYVGSGSVIGHLLSQYSLSEYEGYLRVASTKGDPWWGEDGESESFVTVMEEKDNALKPIGQVGGLGKGEQIFAVRFIGDVGYVVTFEQIDPLYTVDLSEPANPTVLGELKIPGFSSYLHPADENILLGIGQDGTDEGQTTGAQVSSFNITDLTNPTRVDALNFGENSYSSIDWDPLAFTWWGPTRTAFVPVSSYAYDPASNIDENRAWTAVIQVSEDGSLTELGRIEHPRTEECESDFFEDDIVLEEESAPEAEPTPTTTVPGEAVDAEAELVEQDPIEIERPGIEPVPGDYCWAYQPEIRRSVLIGETVYSVSDNGIQISTLDGLATEKWVPFSK